MGPLLAACLFACLFIQLITYKYGELSQKEFSFAFYGLAGGFTLLYWMVGGPVVIGGLVIFCATRFFFYIIVNKLDARQGLNRKRAATRYGKAAIEDETSRRN